MMPNNLLREVKAMVEIAKKKEALKLLNQETKTHATKH